MGWLGIRTIRGQLTAGLLLLQLLFTVLFASLLLRAQLREVGLRATRRLTYQSHLLALESSNALLHNDVTRLSEMTRVMRSSPSIRSVRVTDAAGNTVVRSDNGTDPLTPLEQANLTTPGAVSLFRDQQGRRESVARIYAGNRLLGYGFIREDPSIERDETLTLIRLTVLFGVLGTLASVMASALLARTITRPLRAVLEGTRRLIRDPETKEGFPLVVHEKNEAAELANAFNLMVLSMEEQRAGLSDTLALLDSMLAHAPIGFAFFDRRYRYVRVNHFLAEKTGIAVNRYLGRAVGDIFPQSAARRLQEQLERVFTTGVAVLDFEFDPDGGEEQDDAPDTEKRTWLLNIYPVKTGQQAVRWVGAVIMDATDRKRAEETLRRTEKLAAAGRLAGSIAHEINNPLEAVTNLIYLLGQHSSLDHSARVYVEMAEHQLSRVSEITQQMLRFYRQSTLPVMTSMPELIESIVGLYHGRIHALHVDVQRRYDTELELHCVPGGLRQIFANLIANALDAMPTGGKLLLRGRRSRSWRNGASGVRMVVADTGSGIPERLVRRIFEPFFTTKEATGTGLGLWVSLGIVDKHNGTVAVRTRTQAGEGGSSGTVFMIFFPDGGAPASMGREAETATAV